MIGCRQILNEASESAIMGDPGLGVTFVSSQITESVRRRCSFFVTGTETGASFRQTQRDLPLRLQINRKRNTSLAIAHLGSRLVRSPVEGR